MEEDFDQAYKEWCEKNHRFIVRYINECVYANERYCNDPAIYTRTPYCLRKEK